jgi:superfamily I DNA/RNA helicase
MPPLIPPDLWQPIGIDGLEQAAWEALREPGSTCVLAGPGAGKTEFLAQRATYLLQTGLCPPPYRILAIAFKKDAADNLSTRVKKRCPPDQAGRFTSITFDSFTKSLVDRFLPAIPPYWKPTKPYDIVFPKKRDMTDFFTRARTDAPINMQSSVVAINESEFENKNIGIFKLPLEDIEVTSGLSFAMQKWWHENLRDREPSALTFTMLNRLAELLLRSRPQILRSLRATYKYVFVDEFQDTTYAQYDFLMSAFHGGNTIITAVGDDKQRIMTWAGARTDSFALFQRDFNAVRIQLLFNFRSSPDLVRIQHVVARAIDAGTMETQAQSEQEIDGDVAEIWSFRTEDQEAEKIATWLSSDMRDRNLEPRDYAILVRQTADRFESQLQTRLAAAGLKTRNESRAIGKTTLQDLLVEELTRIGISLLRLGVSRRSPEAWALVSEAMLYLHGADPEDDLACQKSEDLLLGFLTSLRNDMAETIPSKETAAGFATQIIDFLNPEALSRIYTQYSSGDSLAIAIEAFRLHLGVCADGAPDWKSCFDNFEGKDQIPLMTVHKSKGLEYDTIIFMGLDDRMWWSHTPENPEGLATFFVALSRAKQRAIFTFCQQRGQRRGIADIYQLLAEAGVPEQAFN